MKGIFEYHVVSRQKPGPVSAYAYVRSSGKDKRKIYTVLKYRDRNYICSCPDSMFRMPKRCKHVKTFIAYEHMQKMK